MGDFKHARPPRDPMPLIIVLVVLGLAAVAVLVISSL